MRIAKQESPRVCRSVTGKVRMADKEKQVALSQKRKAHRATPCDTCSHPLASHHALGKCKNKNCRCYRFVSLATRKSGAQGQKARHAAAA